MGMIENNQLTEKLGHGLMRQLNSEAIGTHN